VVIVDLSLVISPAFIRFARPPTLIFVKVLAAILPAW
jgi:hypothetical protein